MRDIEIPDSKAVGIFANADIVSIVSRAVPKWESLHYKAMEVANVSSITSARFFTIIADSIHQTQFRLPANFWSCDARAYYPVFYI